MDRRQFLQRVLKVGGVTAALAYGFPLKEIYAASSAIMGSCQTAASGCGDLSEQFTSGGVSQNITYSTSAEVFVAGSFTATGSGLIKTVYVDIKDGGSPAGNLYMYLCGDNEGVPDSGTALSNCTQSTTTDVTAPGSSFVRTKYKFDGYSVTSGLDYWVILTHSTGVNSGTDYFIVATDSTDETQAVYDSPDGTNWTSIDTSKRYNLITTSCDE